jgi:hypothetical protein
MLAYVYFVAEIMTLIFQLDQPGDEVKAVDGVNVENYNLSSVTKLVVGAASTEVSRNEVNGVRGR